MSKWTWVANKNVDFIFQAPFHFSIMGASCVSENIRSINDCSKLLVSC